MFRVFRGSNAFVVRFKYKNQRFPIVSLPRITIVTISYNQAEFLEETLRSVIEQDYPNLEYIVIDGGSTDGSVEIIRKYSDEIDYWISEPDSGQSAAINKGFARATGELGTWINSDDVLIPGALQRIGKAWGNRETHLSAKVAKLQADETHEKFSQKETRGTKDERAEDRRPEAIIICGDAYHFQVNAEHTGPTGPNLEHYIRLADISLENLVCYWREACSWEQPAIFFPLELYRQVGGVDEDQHIAMDYDLFCRIFQHAEAVYVNEPVVRIRRHAEAKTCKWNYRTWMVNKEISKRYWAKVPGGVNRKEFANAFCGHCLTQARIRARRHDWRAAAELLRAALKESPAATLKKLIGTARR